MKDFIDIYEASYCVEGEHSSIWFFDRFGESLVAGASPSKDVAAIALASFNKDMVKKNSRKKDIASMLHAEFSGTKLSNAVSKWARVYDGGEVKWMKNYSNDYALPFKSLNEMFMFCDLQGWPRPAWLDDIVNGIASNVILEKCHIHV